MKIEGYGYDWDAKLVGGPADGCVDRVIQINSKYPPRFFIRIIDGEELIRESLGEKLIEYLTRNNLDENQIVAIYKLTTDPEEIKDESEECCYEYVETTKFGQYKIKYEGLNESK
jgi:hypothetical protein